MACGGPAYGYSAARDATSGERKVHSEQAETVRRIFRWFADGKFPRWIESPGHTLSRCLLGQDIRATQREAAPRLGSEESPCKLALR